MDESETAIWRLSDLNKGKGEKEPFKEGQGHEYG